MQPVRPGSLLHIITDATETTTVTLPANAYGKDVLLLHHISGSTGGYCTLNLSPDDGTTAIPHHGDATGVKTSNSTASYSAIYRNCTEVNKLTLTVGGGTHNVWVQVLA